MSLMVPSDMALNPRPPKHHAAHQKGEAHRLNIWRRFAAAKQRKRGERWYADMGVDWCWYLMPTLPMNLTAAAVPSMAPRAELPWWIT